MFPAKLFCTFSQPSISLAVSKGHIISPNKLFPWYSLHTRSILRSSKPYMCLSLLGRLLCENLDFYKLKKSFLPQGSHSNFKKSLYIQYHIVLWWWALTMVISGFHEFLKVVILAYSSLSPLTYYIAGQLELWHACWMKRLLKSKFEFIILKMTILLLRWFHIYLLLILWKA